jgi:hypothetical protein
VTEGLASAPDTDNVFSNSDQYAYVSSGLTFGTTSQADNSQEDLFS